MDIKKPVNKTLSIQVADELENQIAAGRWALGSKIPSETELMEIFGVSRNTLREAIRFLVISGVLKTKPGNGTFIINETVFNASIKKRLEKVSLNHILETRVIIEPQIVALAALRRSQTEMDTLKKLHENLLQNYKDAWSRYIDADVKFHRHLARMCHNPFLEDLYRAIAEHLPQYIIENFSTCCDEHLDLFLHKELVKAIDKKDQATALKITKNMLGIEREMFTNLP